MIRPHSQSVVPAAAPLVSLEEPCPGCGGEGSVIVSGEWPWELVRGRCGLCDGKGSVTFKVAAPAEAHA
jgi:DnaJ-class molecular chaperone